MKSQKVLSFIFFLCLSVSLMAQGPWTQKASLGGNARHRPFTFSIGSRGYLGCGWNGVTMYQDVWEYDPGSNSWMQKADYPTGPRLSPFGFSIGNKGYVGCGLDQNLYVQSDVHEYNPVTNTWTTKASWIGTPIFGGSSAVVNNIGYVMCGDDWDLGYWRHNEVYSYNPANNSWTFTTTFPADGRRDPCAFVVNNKIYVGTGSDNTYTDVGDWYEFNPANGVWTTKANFAGSPRSQAVAFGVNGKGYLGTGGQMDVQDFWEYDATLNTWTEVNSFPGQGRENSASFVIGNLAYVACGTSGTNYSDCWEFNSNNMVGINENQNLEMGSSVFPNPIVATAILKIENGNVNVENELSIFSSDGKCVMKKKFNGNELEFSREGISAGMYFYAVNTNGRKIASGKMLIQ